MNPSIAGTAAALLEKLGEPVTFQAPADPGTVDPATGRGTPGAAPAAIIADAYPSQYEQGEVDGETIKRGDIRLITEVISSRPAVGWVCTVDGEAYRVMGTRPIRKAGADVIYLVQLRAN